MGTKQIPISDLELMIFEEYFEATSVDTRRTPNTWTSEVRDTSIHTIYWRAHPKEVWQYYMLEIDGSTVYILGHLTIGGQFIARDTLLLQRASKPIPLPKEMRGKVIEAVSRFHLANKSPQTDEEGETQAKAG